MTLVTGWLPLWAFLLLLVAMACATVALYRTDRVACGALGGWTVTLLRIFLLASILFILLDPALVETTTEEKRGDVLLLVDTSRSMAIEDVEGPASPSSRIEAARKLLSSHWLKDLENRFDVSLHSLAKTIAPIGQPQELSLDTSGQTNLAGPLLQKALRAQREDLAGIILVTDGHHNTPEDPRQAARSLGAIDIPIICLGVGRTERPADLVLENIEAPRRVFKGDEISAELTLRNTGIETGEITVTVLEGAREVASFLIEELPGTEISHWPLRFTLDEPGRHKLDIGFANVKGEALVENNRQELWLEVLDDEARVLYLEGSPRWEYRYLKNTWDRDEKISLDSHLIAPPPGRKLPAEFPGGPEELAEYDAIILGDIELELIDENLRASLLEYVKSRGGTLVLVAGPDAMPSSWTGTALEELLPVKLASPPPGRDLGSQLARDGAELTLTADGEESEICRLLPGRQRNLELWELLPAPRWYHPVAGLVEGSLLLATAGEEEAPVLASRKLGTGKVFYSGIDSTWRWRLRFGDLLYKRFWGEVIRWAVSDQLNAVDSSVRLGTDKAVYRFEESIAISALVKNDREGTTPASLVDAVIRLASSPEQELRLRLRRVPGGGGRYEGRLPASRYGPLLEKNNPQDGTPAGAARAFELMLDVSTIPGYSSRPDRATIDFAVEPPVENEALDIYCDDEGLREMAKLSGGAYLHISEAAGAIDLLPEKIRAVERTYTYAALDHPWALALLLVSLLGIEWVARKALKLV